MEIEYNDKNRVLDEIAGILEENSARNNMQTVSDCTMSEKVIAYAFNELGPDEMSEVQLHLTECPDCDGLAQDIRSADADARQAPAGPPEMLPALSDAVKKTKPPRHRKKWRIRIPDLSPGTLYPKILGAVATACLALIIIEYCLQAPGDMRYDKTPGKTTTIREQIAKPNRVRQVVKKKTRPAKTRESINSITVHDNSFIDPFQPPDSTPFRPSAIKNRRVRRIPHTPLESLDLSQLKLVGIILSASGNRAVVEDAAGRGYVLQEGTYVGRHAGKVTAILNDRIIIEEEIEDFAGQIIKLTRDLKLNES